MANGHVYKRGKKYYLYIYTGRTIDGKRERVRRVCKSTTKAGATTELTEELYRLDRIASGNPSNDCLLEVLAESYTGHVRATTPNEATANDKVRKLNKAMAEVTAEGIINSTHVTAALLEKVAAKIAEGSSTNTANKSVRQFYNMLKYAQENRMIRENPLRHCPQLKLVRKKFRRAFTEAEIAALLECATDTWRVFYLCAVYTGFRLQEMVNLQWPDIDFRANTISINEKTDWKPKTTSSVRTLPMSKVLAKELKKLPQDTEYVFSTRNNNKRNNNVLRHFKAACRRMLEKLNPNWSAEQIKAELTKLDFHALRYSFCTKLIKTGVDPKTTQKLMGHADIQTTLNIYAQFCPQTAETAIKNLSWE